MGNVCKRAVGLQLSILTKDQHIRVCTRTAYLYNGCLAWYNVLITSRVHSSVKSQFPKVRQTKYTAADSCDGGRSVLNHCLSWSKFVNTHLSQSRHLNYRSSPPDNFDVAPPVITSQQCLCSVEPAELISILLLAFVRATSNKTTSSPAWLSTCTRVHHTMKAVSK